MPRFSGDVRASISVPSFTDNFDTATGKIANPTIDLELQQAALMQSN